MIWGWASSAILFTVASCKEWKNYCHLYASECNEKGDNLAATSAHSDADCGR